MNVFGTTGLAIAGGLAVTAVAVGTAYKLWNNRKVTPETDPAKKVPAAETSKPTAKDDGTTQPAEEGLFSRCVKGMKVPCSYLCPVAKSIGLYLLQRFVTYGLAGALSRYITEPMTSYLREGVFREGSATYEALTPAAANDTYGLYTPVQGFLEHGFAACFRDGIRYAVSKLSFGHIQAPGQREDAELQDDLKKLRGLMAETQKFNKRLSGLEEAVKKHGSKNKSYPVLDHQSYETRANTKNK